MNTKFIPEKYYDRDRLKALFLFKGIGDGSYGGYMRPASEMLCCEEKTAQYKINKGALSHEETILLAKGLNLTAREYAEVFMRGVFEKASPNDEA